MTNGGGHESIPSKMSSSDKQVDKVTVVKKTVAVEPNAQDKPKH